MSEKLKEVVELEDESQIVAQDAHDDYYDSRSIIPADNVDADGVPWATVGENIRNGAKAPSSKEKVLEAISALLDTDVKYEVVNCTLSPGRNIVVDNTLFVGRSTSITSSKTIILFFVLSCNINSGNNMLSFLLNQNVNNTILIQNTSNSAITGTIKLGVLLA
nr:MAG TPA: hypothetical protein [Caudoviricetes sp.]